MPAAADARRAGAMLVAMLVAISATAVEVLT